jgi:uncharacterized membrane protein
MFLRAFIATIVTFLAVDIAWISLVLIDVYRDSIGDIMRDEPAAGGGALFYVAYTAGIVFLASRPAIEKRSVGPAIVNGAVLGALAYGTYTVTNYTILEGWTLTLLVSDIAWGAFLTSVCAVAGYYAGRTGLRDTD